MGVHETKNKKDYIGAKLVAAALVISVAALAAAVAALPHNKGRENAEKTERFSVEYPEIGGASCPWLIQSCIAL